MMCSRVRTASENWCLAVLLCMGNLGFGGMKERQGNDMKEMTTKEFEEKIKDMEGIVISLETPAYDKSKGYCMEDDVYDYFFDERAPGDMTLENFVARLKPSVKAYEIVILDGNNQEIRSYVSTVQAVRDSYK